MNFNFILTKKFIIIIMAILAIVLNAAPYAYQAYCCNYAGMVYTGSYPVTSDQPTYLAEITQGKDGNWKMLDKYTTEPQKPAYAYIFYTTLGHVAKTLDLSAETMLFISRFVFGIALLIVLIYFIRYFVPDEKRQILAYFFAFFASGLGWLTSDRLSPDLWIPEAIPMVRFSYFPHISLGNILFFLAILFFYRSFKEQKIKLALVAGLAVFTLNFVLTFYTVLLYWIIFFFAAIAYLKDRSFIRKNLKNILVFFATSLPSFAYMLHMAFTNPIWRAVEEQNKLPIEPLLSLIAGYGPTMIFSIAGIYAIYKKDSLKGLLFFVWIFSAFFLAHIPSWIYPMQRRFLDAGLYAPLAITAAYGLIGIYEYFKKKNNIAYADEKFRALFIMFIAPFLLLGNLQNLIDFNSYIKGTDDSSLYIPSNNIEAMEWLRKNSPKESIAIASPHNGILIPYYADRFVYAGHGPSTLDFSHKIEKVYGFYSGNLSSEETYEFLKKERINYVFYSDSEKEMGEFDPSKYDFLEKVYQNKKAGIYKAKIKDGAI